MRINKKNLKEILDSLEERYGDIKISELRNQIWEDEDFESLSLFQKLLYGKRFKINLKSKGRIKNRFTLGKKI